MKRRLCFLSSLLCVAAWSQAQTNYWQVNSDGFWDIGSNWSLGQPSSAHTVSIGYAPHPYPGIKTTYRTGITTISRLLTKAAFEVTGGELILSSTTQPSLVEGPFSMTNDGRLGLSGTLNVTGPATFANGFIGGVGNVVFSGGISLDAAFGVSDEVDAVNTGHVSIGLGGALRMNSLATFRNALTGTLEVLVDSSNYAVQGGTLINEGMMLRPAGSFRSTVVTDVLNSGTVRCLAGELRFSNGSMNNSGLIEATNGALIEISPSTNSTFLNTGAIVANGPDAFVKLAFFEVTKQELGNIQAVNGGTVWWKAFLDNTGADLDLALADTGHFWLGGTIKGGRILNSQNLELEDGLHHTIDGVELDEGVTIQPGYHLYVKGNYRSGGTTVVSSDATAGKASIIFKEDLNQSIVANIELAGGRIGHDEENGLLVIEPGSSITGHGFVDRYFTASVAGRVVENRGLFSANVTNKSITFHPTISFTNHGRLEAISNGMLSIRNVVNHGVLDIAAGSSLTSSQQVAQQIGSSMVNGVITTPMFVLSGGVLSGTGSISGSLQNRGKVTPGQSAGTLTVGTNYSQFDFGVLEVEVGGTTSGLYDKLNVNGSGLLGGTLHIRNTTGAPIDPSAVLEVASFAGGRTGTFANVTWDGTQAWTVTYTANGVRIQAVPEYHVAPASITAINGTPIGARLTEVLTSNDQYFRVQNALNAARNTPAVQIVADATSPLPTPGTVAFTIEVGTSLPNFTQTVEMFDFTTGNYEVVDSRQSSTSDSTIVVTPGGNISRFIEPGTLKMRSRLSLKATANDLSRQWNARVDFVSWRINP